MGEVIKTVNLTKDYGTLRAVDKLNITVNEGEILGFLGLNGAGKTTTLKMLLGMVSPTEGNCYLQGERVSPRNKAIWHQVGYLVETAHSYPDLTVKENLELVSKLRGIREPTSVQWIIKKLGLTAYSGVKSKNLSLGNAQRLGIAKALLHKPKILLLDEPTNGLDPAGVVEIRELLLDLAKNFGVTMIISSHKLAEIARLATNIAIIHQGKLLKNIPTAELENQLEKSLLVATRNLGATLEVLAEAGYEVSFCPGQDKLKILTAEAIAKPEIVAKLLVNSGYPPSLLQVEKEDLESYFLRIINGTRRV